MEKTNFNVSGLAQERQSYWVKKLIRARNNVKLFKNKLDAHSKKEPGCFLEVFGDIVLESYESKGFELLESLNYYRDQIVSYREMIKDEIEFYQFQKELYEFEKDLDRSESLLS